VVLIHGALLDRRPWTPQRPLARRFTPPAIRRLGEVRFPVLVVTGDDDLRDTRLAADTITAGIPQAQRIRLPRAGHLLTITAAEDFNRLLVAFLEGHPPG